MSKLASIRVKGTSGTAYIFHLYPWGTAFKPVGAVYVVTRRSQKSSGGFHHKRIHIGTTADLSQGVDQEEQQDKFERYAANCIWVHRETDPTVRNQIQRDLAFAR